MDVAGAARVRGCDRTAPNVSYLSTVDLKGTKRAGNPPATGLGQWQDRPRRGQIRDVDDLCRDVHDARAAERPDQVP